MKKRNYIILFVWAAAALALVSCMKEKEADNPASNAGGGIPFKLIARSAETKTVNDGLSTRWVEGDAVNVFHAVAGSSDYVNDGAFTITDVEDGVFSGTLASGLDPTQSYDWYVLYPYSGESTSPEEASVTFPPVQSQTWDGNMAQLGGLPLAGKATTEAGVSIPSVSMKQLSAVIQVGITNGLDTTLPVTEVKFTAPVPIAGSYTVNLTDPSAPVYTRTPEGSDWQTVTLSASSIETEAGGGSTCYLAVRPFTAESASKLKMYLNGYEKSVVLESDRAFSAGAIYDFGFQYDQKKLVACWGDSVTHDHHGYTYTTHLAKYLGEDWDVFDGGHGGDKSVEIMFRQGCVRARFVKDYTFSYPTTVSGLGTVILETIPSTVGVEDQFRAKDRFKHTDWRGFNPCTINGIQCNVAYSSVTPLEACEDVPGGWFSSYGSTISPSAAVNIYLIGANGGFKGTDHLVAQQRAMIDYGSKNYIVLGYHYSMAHFISIKPDMEYDYPAKMEAAFGDHFLNLNKEILARAAELTYLTGVYKDPDGFYNNVEDQMYYEVGDMPKSFYQSDNVHPNKYGCAAFAMLIHDKMVKLGYLDDKYILSTGADL